MSLYDKLLPWRSQRSGTSLARVCAGNALQMGEQLPYSRVRLLVGKKILLWCSFNSLLRELFQGPAGLGFFVDVTDWLFSH